MNCLLSYKIGKQSVLSLLDQALECDYRNDQSLVEPCHKNWIIISLRASNVWVNLH
jgi:hypothetical protein